METLVKNNKKIGNRNDTYLREKKHRFGMGIFAQQREKQRENERKVLGLIKDKATGEIYLNGIANYYKRQRVLYKNYTELERAQLKLFLATTSEDVRTNFSNLCQH